MVKLPGLDGEPELDFAIEWRDVSVQSDQFLSTLLSLCGELGLALVFTQYPPKSDRKQNVSLKKKR
ncbi:MAG: hypothetical protein MJA29_08065 [Candidatus Omnitrophica bacterium]|nr:hypothetical protein [Candidatus Omnitrophota bacterium]